MLKGKYSWFKLLKESAKEFSNDNVVKLSASLAYYTIFAIGPLLLVIISLTGLFFEAEAVTGKMYWQMRSLVGEDGANQIISIIQNMRAQNAAAKYSIIGFVILVFGATGVFADIQDSINYIWSIKAKPKKGWLKFITNRLLSFSIILGIGFLLIVSLLVNIVADALTGKLQEIFASTTVVIFQILNIAILFGIISILFAVIYKVLPDARIKWKDAFVGARFTGILFLIGKFLIGYYLGTSNLASTYGAAASVIIILSWVYYTSIILYFGAEFTKVYALNRGGGIVPYDTAVFIIKREAKELPNLTADIEEKKD
ncbi:MAG: YihY/virulence factor BrkB family protein [Sphingobacteriales bacterium]|nr:MAG: YihY/virulence factor BrkB family protein [Sphingobacteriales bacterium]